MNAPRSVYSQPKPPATEAEFPNGNMVDDKVYQMANPANPLQQMAMMSMETFMKSGTLIQSLRNVAKSQDKRLKELLNQLSVCQSQLKDAQERLENLRKVRKAEKRGEVEEMLDLPFDYHTAPKE
jgi:lipopolysaccharide biosynthesis regulator YciM